MRRVNSLTPSLIVGRFAIFLTQPRWAVLKGEMEIYHIHAAE